MQVRNTITQVNLGTRFEQYDDIYLSTNITAGFDNLTVDNTASIVKKQAGDFTEFYLAMELNRIKDRSFVPTDAIG